MMVITVFLLCVFVATYVQTVTGFAMGMIILAVIGGLRLMDIPTLTAVASLMSLANVVLALRSTAGHIQWNLYLWLSLGQLPGIALGVWCITYLDGEARWLAELLLGSFITLGSLSMMLRPHSKSAVSPWYSSLGAGIAGGIVGGMFSASGPVLGWFNYRQPLPLNAIRATLFASFALTTLLRTVVVGSQGGLTSDVWLYSALALPLVVAATWLGRHFPPALPEASMKRLAFGLLVAMGLWIIVSALVIGRNG
jgi:uncharacterized membrane protein YfcA